MLSLRRIKSNKTVEEVLSVFNKTLNDLESIIDQNSDVMGASQKIIDEEHQRILSAQKEMNKAAIISNKITQLISE